MSALKTWRWLDFGDTHYALIEDCGKRPAILVGHSLKSCGDDGLLHSFDVKSEIARKIEAAPELLNLLVYAYENPRAMELNSGFVAEVRAAIARVSAP